MYCAIISFDANEFRYDGDVLTTFRRFYSSLAPSSIGVQSKVILRRSRDLLLQSFQIAYVAVESSLLLATL